MANVSASHGMSKVLGHTVNDVKITALSGKTSQRRRYPGTGFKFILLFSMNIMGVTAITQFIHVRCGEGSI